MQDTHNHSAHKHLTETILVILFALLALLLLAPRVHSQDAANQRPAAALQSLTLRTNGPLPMGTRLLSLRVINGLAVADFSPELKANFSGGDSQEVAAVNSVLRVLGRYPEITQAQILLAGRPLDSLGGLLALSNPLPVLRPDQDNSGHTRRLFLHRRLPLEKGKTVSHTHPSLT